MSGPTDTSTSRVSSDGSSSRAPWRRAAPASGTRRPPTRCTDGSNCSPRSVRAPSDTGTCWRPSASRPARVPARRALARGARRPRPRCRQRRERPLARGEAREDRAHGGGALPRGPRDRHSPDHRQPPRARVHGRRPRDWRRDTRLVRRFRRREDVGAGRLRRRARPRERRCPRPRHRERASREDPKPDVLRLRRIPQGFDSIDGSWAARCSRDEDGGGRPVAAAAASVPGIAEDTAKQREVFMRTVVGSRLYYGDVLNPEGIAAVEAKWLARRPKRRKRRSGRFGTSTRGRRRTGNHPPAPPARTFARDTSPRSRISGDAGRLPRTRGVS